VEPSRRTTGPTGADTPVGGRRRDLSPAGIMFVKYGRDNVTLVRPIHTRD